MFAEDIPPAVYDNLLAGVRAHLPLFYRYLQLRRQALGLDELHMYDIYTPLAQERPREISYPEACQLVLRALQPLSRLHISEPTRLRRISVCGVGG